MSATTLRRLAPAGPATSLQLLAGLGVFLAAVDQTCVVAVLPKMTESIGLAQDQFYRAAWIVNGYILGYVVAMPLMGRISDAAGHGRIFALSMGIFILGSLGVALAGDLTMLSIMRAVQAVGGGALVPVSMAIVLDQATVERRALGLGAMAAAAEAGGLLGPLWGGGIATFAGWRTLFWINLPLCLPIALAVWRLAPCANGGSLRGIDFPGATLLGASLVALTIALTDDPITPRSTALTLALFATAAICFGAFLLRQRATRVPIIDLARFRRLPLSAGFLTNLLSGGALLVAMVTVPLFTNVVLQQSALQGGINLMRMTIALPVGALAGGYLANRLGFSLTAALGLVLAAVGFIGMSGWSSDPGFFAMTLPLLVAGFGFGLIIAPVNAAVLDEVDVTERATMASLLTVMRLVGALVGVALLTTRGLGGFYSEAGLVPLGDPNYVEILTRLQVQSLDDVFLVTAGVCLATLLPAMLLGRRRA